MRHLILQLLEAARSDSKTPAAPSERVYGSERNEVGSASTANSGIEVGAATEAALRNLIASYSEQYPKAPKPSMGQLKAVYRRGAGAFSASHRPNMNRNQWALARVNTFLKMLRGDAVKQSYRAADQDLL
jgi:hypothetical protein